MDVIVLMGGRGNKSYCTFKNKFEKPTINIYILNTKNHYHKEFNMFFYKLYNAHNSNTYEPLRFKKSLF